MAYVSRSCDFPKKEIFDGLHKHFLGGKFKKFPFLEISFLGISFFGNFDGLYKHFFGGKNEIISFFGNFDGLDKQIM